MMMNYDELYAGCEKKMSFDFSFEQAKGTTPLLFFMEVKQNGIWQAEMDRIASIKGAADRRAGF